MFQKFDVLAAERHLGVGCPEQVADIARSAAARELQNAALGRRDEACRFSVWLAAYLLSCSIAPEDIITHPAYLARARDVIAEGAMRSQIEDWREPAAFANRRALP